VIPARNIPPPSITEAMDCRAGQSQRGKVVRLSMHLLTYKAHTSDLLDIIWHFTLAYLLGGLMCLNGFQILEVS
jgi:hypothetical protein